MKIIKFVCFGICVLLASVLTYQSQHTNTAPFVLHSFDSLDSMVQETPILPHILEDSLDFSSNFMLVPNFEKSAHASSLVDLGTKLMVVFFCW